MFQTYYGEFNWNFEYPMNPISQKLGNFLNFWLTYFLNSCLNSLASSVLFQNTLRLTEERAASGLARGNPYSEVTSGYTGQQDNELVKPGSSVKTNFLIKQNLAASKSFKNT